MAGNWVRRYGPRDTGVLRLFCFHYAGGNAAMFRDWHTALDNRIEPVAVQLPGRDDRYAEKPHEHMDTLVPDLLAGLAPLMDKPFACYGFSMGARVAHALTHALRERGMALPTHLFVASSAAPALGLPVRGWAESDAGLVTYLRELGGTPAGVFDHPELRELFLPTVRADLKLVGTCPPPPRPPLPVPIRAFAGSRDTEATPDRMLPWQAETTAAFSLTVVPGAHFFTPKGMGQVLAATAEDLTAGAHR